MFSVAARRVRKSALRGLYRRVLHPNHEHLTRPIAFTGSGSRSNHASSSVAYRIFSTEGKESMEFQAETRKLLDIVTNSIYTDKEVFLRELISNASDSLEKYRFKQSTGALSPTVTAAPSGSLQITITTDPVAKTLTITDNGIGMSKEELVGNLGTIARSGSKKFVEEMISGAGGEGSGAGSKEGIIGQFGVGFYSSFMVAESVEVESLSAVAASEGQTVEGNTESETTGYKWSSDGTGIFHLEKVSAASLTRDLLAPVVAETSDGSAGSEGVKEAELESTAVGHGSKITLFLKDSCKDFADAEKIKGIIKRYSSFVSFPVVLNGEVVNTVSAIWAKDKRSVTEAQYTEFYKFIANAFDEPKYRLHFTTDAPIDLKCLFFVPSFHSEKFGMGRMEPGVNLYSRKVLIESKPKDILPEWLRFVKGVVDSEDLPLSISREKAQDSQLLARIRDVITRKLLRFLGDESGRDKAKYLEFYAEYHMFLKEGLCQDYKFLDPLSKLLRFESSQSLPDRAKSAEGERTDASGSDSPLISLDDYVSRCAPGQKHIYYLVAPSREAALSSPYFETFKKHKIEVLFLYNAIDDFVMSNLRTYAGRTLTSAETSSLDLDSETADEAANDKEGKEIEGDKTAEDVGGGTVQKKLSEVEATELCLWLTSTLGAARVREVRVTHRLSDSPAIVTDHESGAMRRMMKMVEQANAGRTLGSDTLPPQVLEINPSHPLICALHAAKDAGTGTAAGQLVAQQLLDNALIAAGLVEDPRYMLPRLNDLLLASLKPSTKP